MCGCGLIARASGKGERTKGASVGVAKVGVRLQTFDNCDFGGIRTLPAGPSDPLPRRNMAFSEAGFQPASPKCASPKNPSATCNAPQRRRGRSFGLRRGNEIGAKGGRAWQTGGDGSRLIAEVGAREEEYCRKSQKNQARMSGRDRTGRRAGIAGLVKAEW